MISIYTDGSCSGNPGPGGYGVVVIEYWDEEDNATILDVTQHKERYTTNNRMEMEAILWALEHYGDAVHRGNGFSVPIVYSDSSYCVKSFTEWIYGWKLNDWTRANGKPLENLDLIKKYDELTHNGHRIDLRYCQGHAGNTWNELADKLATGKISVSEVLK